MDQTTQFQQASPPFPYRRSWHVTDIVFHYLVIVFDIVVLGISVALALNVTLGVYLLLWTIPQVGVSLLWSIAELITKCARRDHQGIHPGAHVALHLLLWLGFCASAVLNGFLLASLIIYADHADDNYYYGYYDYDYYGLGSDYLTLVQALVAFVALLIITHFILFVRACIGTARLNHSRVPVMMSAQTYQHQYGQPAYHVQPHAAHISK